jgi:hypothetical protein
MYSHGPESPASTLTSQLETAPRSDHPLALMGSLTPIMRGCYRISHLYGSHGDAHQVIEAKQVERFLLCQLHNFYSLEKALFLSFRAERGIPLVSGGAQRKRDSSRRSE